MRDDAEKFLVRLHDETLDVVALLRCHWSRTVQDVLELTAFENDRRQAELVEELFVIQRLNDHADASGNGSLVRH